jgi:pimeloyl-ACP methyl ester carboxylesterase
MKPLPQDRFIDVGATRIRTRYWDVGGEGRSCVLLLHGIGCSVLEWDRNVEALAAHHRVIAVDLMGFGLSAKPADADYTLKGHADFVLSFMDALGIQRAHIAGNSLGGRLALSCAAMAPQRVASLLLVDPAGMDRFGTLFDFRVATLPLMGELLTRASPIGLRMLWRKAFFKPDAFVTQELVNTKVTLAAQPGAQVAFLKTLRHFLDLKGFRSEGVSELHAALPHMLAPTLVLWGRQDRFVPAAHAEVLRKMMKNIEIQIWDACGHTPQIENAPRFNETSLAFWKRVEAGAKASSLSPAHAAKSRDLGHES